MQAAPERERVRILSEKDLKFSYYCGSGAGGQARNKVASGVMIRHEESGAISSADDSRSQTDNKRKAFERLLATPEMKFWLAKRVYEVQQQETIEQAAERDMASKNLRFEIKNEKGQWEQAPEEYFETAAAKGE